MPVKRRRVVHKQRSRITDAVIDAYLEGDYLELHRLLRLPPWHPSPLPTSVTALGVDPGDPPTWEKRCDLYRVAQELQTEIEAVIAEREGNHGPR